MLTVRRVEMGWERRDGGADEKGREEKNSVCRWYLVCVCPCKHIFCLITRH